jgi:hypothetical protein
MKLIQKLKFQGVSEVTSCQGLDNVLPWAAAKPVGQKQPMWAQGSEMMLHDAASDWLEPIHHVFHCTKSDAGEPHQILPGGNKM